MEDLDTTLLHIINRSPKSFIIVDALDECEDLKLRSDILSFIQHLFNNATTDLYVLITSRPDIDIEAALNRFQSTTKFVAFDTKMVDEDIRSHLNLLMRNPPYSEWSERIKHKVVDHIARRSGGVFRWADLQVQALRGKSREIDVDRALRSLPGTLGGTYKRMIDRIKFENYHQEAVTVLRWLNRARTPLTLDQVAELAAFDVQTADVKDPVWVLDNYTVIFQPQNRFDRPSEILRVLSGLVTVTESMDMLVSFAHFSVQEYLESNEAPDDFKLQDPDCDWFIFKSCLAYIDNYDSLAVAESFKPSYPLLLYACSMLWKHAEKLFTNPGGSGDKEGWTQSIALSLKPLLNKSGYALDLALQCANINTPNSAKDVSIFMRNLSHPFGRDDFSAAVRIEDPRLLTFLFRAGVNTPEDALLWAVKKPTSERLSLNPLDQNRQKTETVSDVPNTEAALAIGLQSMGFAESRVALSATDDCIRTNESTNQRRAIWDLLLKSPMININATNPEQQTPLLLAALSGDEPFFQFLFSLEDTKRDHCDVHGWNVATCALVGGNRKIVEHVFKCLEVDLELADRYGWTPLEWASYRGFDTIIATLDLPIRPHEPKGSAPRKAFLSFEEIQSHSYGEAEVWKVSFSNSGTHVAVSLSDGQCTINDLSSATTSVSLQGHTGGVVFASWSPDDTLVVTGCQDGRARVFLAKVSPSLPIDSVTPLYRHTDFLALRAGN